jgi:site-specific recombinase XerD
MIENGESSSAKVIWERRWARLAVALSENGVEPRMQSFCRGWVQGFLRFARPKKYFQVQAEDVEEYLHKLVAEGKQNWQVRQAAESLRVFYQQVELVKWAMA